MQFTKVHVWEEPVAIPTEENSDEKKDVTYRAVCLENDFLFVMVLPELGGRIQCAWDKTNNYEFSLPQHYCPFTNEATDYYYKENEDGSATIYISETGKMHGTKSLAALTLYPDRSYIEIKNRLFNNTDIPQSFHWQASPADADLSCHCNVELMTGVYSNNQPDFIRLAPYEEKTFTQYFMPYKHVGGVKNATKDAAVSLELSGNNCVVKAYTSGIFENALIQVTKNSKVLFRDMANLSPAGYYENTFIYEGDSLVGCKITLRDEYNKILISYTEKEPATEPAPEPVDYYQGEHYYNLGLKLVYAGRHDEAIDAFYKATWSYETQCSSFYWLANLAARKNDYHSALQFVEQSLTRNWHNMKARTLKAALMRLLHMDNIAFIEESLKIDPLYMGLLFEKGAYYHNLSEWQYFMRCPAHNYLELALIYMKAGMYWEALEILSDCLESTPMIYYYQGFIFEEVGDLKKARECHRFAELCDSSYCSPNRIEEIPILESAVRVLGDAPGATKLLYIAKHFSE